MTLAEAVENANQLAMSLYGLQFKSDLRSRAAAACFAVAQQHHNAILLLLGNQVPLHSTAFALLRLLIEATIRGLWLSHCASDEQVSNFVMPQHKQLDTVSMMKAIDTVVAVAGSRSSSYKSVYEKHWATLSSYTHTGEHQVQRWLSVNDIEPKYSTAEVSELISLASGVFQLAVASTKTLSTHYNT